MEGGRYQGRYQEETESWGNPGAAWVQREMVDRPTVCPGDAPLPAGLLPWGKAGKAEREYVSRLQR